MIRVALLAFFLSFSAHAASITYVPKLGQCVLTATGKELSRKLPPPIHNEAIYAMLARPNVVVGFMDKRHGVFTSNSRGLHEDIVRLMRLEQEKQDAASR